MQRIKAKRQKISLAVLAVIFALCMGLALSAWLPSKGANAAEDHSGMTNLSAQFLQDRLVTVEGETIGATDQPRTVYILPSGNYYLAGDVSAAYTIRIQDGAQVSLDLNGNNLTYTGDARYRLPLIEVFDAALTVSDCSGAVGTRGGNIDGNFRSGSVISLSNADFNLISGGITGGRGTIKFDAYQNGARIDYNDLARLKAYYGDDYEVEDGYGYGDESFYLMGGGVYAVDSRFTMTGGVIYGNGTAASTAYYWGETVYQYYRFLTGETSGYSQPGNSNYEGVRDLTKDPIVYNYGDEVEFRRVQGGGVYMTTSYANRDDAAKKSSFVMSGGSISNNVSYLHGGGVFLHNAYYEMRGGVLGGETKYIDSFRGEDNYVISFENGGNVATGRMLSLSGSIGGGVFYYRGYSANEGDFTMSGTAEVSYNEASTAAGLNVSNTGGPEGGLWAHNYTVSITGGVKISHNVGGTAVNIGDSASVTINGMRIEENNTATGLSVSGQEISVSNVYISGNRSGSQSSSRNFVPFTLTGTSRVNGTFENLVTEPLANSKITVRGVTVTGNVAYGNMRSSISNGGTVVISDVVITDNRAERYYNANGALTGGNNGLLVSSCGNVSMTNCKISDNYAGASNAGLALATIDTTDDTADAQKMKSSYTLTNVEITGNEAYNNYGGLYIYASDINFVKGGKVTLNGVTVADNRAGSSYAGLAIASSNFGVEAELNDVRIEGNVAAGSYGGMYVGYNAKVAMNGGTISGNSAGTYGANGSAGTSASGGGLYLTAASNTISHTGSYTPLGKSSSEAISGYSVSFLRAGAVMTADGVTVSGNTATNSGAGIYIGGGAIFTPNGSDQSVLAELPVAESGAVQLPGASLTFKNGDVTDNRITGYYALQTNASYYYCNTYYLNGGSGGGVYVGGGSTAVNGVSHEHFGTFIMENGTISGNAAFSHGGGIYASTAVISLTNVNVNNNVSGRENGIYVEEPEAGNGTYGGGIYYVAASCAPQFENKISFTVSGGSVSGNSATHSGGGIYIGGGNYGLLDGALISGVSVTGNTLTGYGSMATATGSVTFGNGTGGGGIYIASSPDTVKIENCDVSYNTARASGGGVYVSASAVEMTNTVVSNNKAGVLGSAEAAGVSANGGGVYLAAVNYNANYATSLHFEMTGGKICNNSATNAGGGMYIGGGNNADEVLCKAVLNGVAVENNASTGYYNANGVLTGGSGGGIHIANAVSIPAVELNGGTVSGNRANTTGGGVHVANSSATNTAKLVLSGASVTANYSAGNGGGVYMAGMYSVVAVSGAAVVQGNGQLNASGEVTYASNVFMNNVSAKITVESLTEGAEIGVHMSANAAGYVFTQGAEADIVSYFFCDRSGYAIVVEGEADFNLRIKTDSAGTGTELPENPGEPSLPEENPAKTITVVLVSDAGGSVAGVTSLYYLGDADDLEQVYVINVREGYYFSSVSFGGYTYYFNPSASGALWYYDGSARAAVTGNAPLYEANGVIYFAVTLSDSEDNEIVLRVKAISSPFSLVGETENLAYTGEEYSVSASIVREETAQNESNFYSLAWNKSSSVEYLVGGVWTTSAPFEVGSYSVRVRWESTPFIGGTSFSGEGWVITIGAQVWEDGVTENIEITVNPSEFTYNENNVYTPAVTVVDMNRGGESGYTLISGTDYEVSFSGNNGAGSGVITVTGIGNYTGVLTATFVIEKAANPLSFDGQLVVNGGTFNNQTQTVSLGMVTAEKGTVTAEVAGPDGATVSMSATGASLTFVNAGAYTVTFTSYGDVNYASDSITVTINVGKAVPTVEVPAAQTIVYNVSGATTYRLSGVSVSYGLAYAVSVSGGASYNTANGMITLGNAGAYTVTVSVAETDNYEGVSESFIITVDPYQVSMPNRDTTTFVYDGTEKTYRLDESAYYTITGALTATNAGNYQIVVSLKDTVNYCWNGGSTAALTYDFNVLRAANEVNLVGVYNPRLTYTGSAQTIDLAGVTVAAGTENALVISVSNGGIWNEAERTVSVTNAGTYVVTFSVPQTANYNAASETLTIVVDRATIARPNQDLTRYYYTGSAQTYQLAEGEGYQVYGSRTYTEAGSYIISVELTDTVNTRWDDNSTSNLAYTFTIEKAPNAITLPSSTMELTFNTAAQNVNLGGATALFGQNEMTIASFGATVTDGVLTVTNAGTYTVTFTVAGTSNYEGATATLVVNVAKLTVNKPVADETRFVYDGTLHTYALEESDYYTIVGDVSRVDAGNTVLEVALKDTGNMTWTDGTTANQRYTFTVAKADPDYSVPELTARVGMKLSDVALPAGWTWAVQNPSEVVIDGTASYSARYTPSDTANYNVVTESLRIQVANAAYVADAPDGLIVALAVLDAAVLATAVFLIVNGRKKNG